MLNAVIVSAEEGSGTFVASLSNNDTQEPITFDGDSTVSTRRDARPPTSSTPVEIAPGGLVNLADEGGIEVTGDFAAGDFVGVTVTFDERRAGRDGRPGRHQLRRLRGPRRPADPEQYERPEIATEEH